MLTLFLKCNRKNKGLNILTLCDINSGIVANRLTEACRTLLEILEEIYRGRNFRAKNLNFK